MYGPKKRSLKSQEDSGKKKKKLAKKIKGCEILNVPFTFQLLFYWLRPVARVGELSVQIKIKKEKKKTALESYFRYLQEEKQT